MQIDALETPCLLLNRAKLETNVETMLQRVERLDLKIRPHLKTAKNIEIALMATRDRTYGITVSTLREAEYFADHGFTDILYAVGIVPRKLDRAATLLNRGIDLKIITDNPVMAKAIAAHGAPFNVMVEVDSGDARGGLQADGPEISEIAAALNPSEANIVGVLTHGGHSYGAGDVAAVQQIAGQERQAVIAAAERLRALDCPIEIVSAGSTPTALHLQDGTGLTELRCGVFVFYDLDQQSRGVCRHEDVALMVLASVIGHNKTAGKILLDAGGLALSKDLGANASRPEVGYGELCDPLTGAPLGGLFVDAVSQEHGHVLVKSEADYDRVPIGSVIAIAPNHACMTAAAYERYHVVEGAKVTAEWKRVNGW